LSLGDRRFLFFFFEGPLALLGASRLLLELWLLLFSRDPYTTLAGDNPLLCVRRCFVFVRVALPR